MLVKTMNQVISKKVNKWLETIEDNNLKKQILNDLVITGGAFPSMINNEEPKDYDCYFKTKETTKAVANYYVAKWNETHQKTKNALGITTKVFVLDGAEPSQEILNYYHISDISDSRAIMIKNTPPDRIKIIFPSDGVVGDPQEVRAEEELGVNASAEILIKELDEISADKIINEEKKEYFPVFISTNAITLSNGIQIVVRFYGEPDIIHETYDFVHTKAYWTNETKTIIPNEVYEAVINKTLFYTGSKYPVCSLFRLRKFIERGYHINAGQILKMCMQVSELDLMNIAILEDQLVGVDSVYFNNMINEFRRLKEKDPDFQLNTGYVMTLVDRMF